MTMRKLRCHKRSLSRKRHFRARRRILLRRSTSKLVRRMSILTLSRQLRWTGWRLLTKMEVENLTSKNSENSSLKLKVSSSLKVKSKQCSKTSTDLETEVFLARSSLEPFTCVFWLTIGSTQNQMTWMNNKKFEQSNKLFN